MKRILFSLLMPLAIACSNASSDDPTSNPPDTNAAIELTSDGHLRLSREAAAGPWLLRGVFLREGTTQPDLLRGRVVHFHDEGGGRWTLRDATDAADPNAPPADAPAIGTFETKAGDQKLDFDLARGLDRIVAEVSVFEPWKEPSKAPTIDIREPSVVATRRDGDTFWVRRQVSIDYPGAGPTKLRLDQALTPYRPPADFAPRPNNDAQGFYVNAPITTPGGAKIAYAHRHHDASPIVFHYVAETPPERVVDIGTAVAYWNDVFARAGAPLRLETAPLEPAVDPILSNHHVIVYDPEPGTGGRGVNQTDPLTGRIVQATVNVNSVFAIAGTDAAEARWARARLDAGEPATPLPDTTRERAVSDYYVNTYAHEIGHCLGMRHNFAGSLGAATDAGGWGPAYNAYLEGDLPEGAGVTSSVMEYVDTPYATLIGAHMRLGRGPLAYDLEAARSMYANGEAKPGLACEAESAALFADCAEFDLGPDPIEGTYLQWEDVFAERAFRVARGLLGGEGPGDPATEALILANPLLSLARHFEEEANFLSVASRYPDGLGEANLTAYRGEVLELQRQGFARIDGPRSIFARTLFEKGRAETANVDALVDDFVALAEGYLEKLGGSGGLPNEFATALRDGLANELAPIADRSLACLTCSP